MGDVMKYEDKINKESVSIISIVVNLLLAISKIVIGILSRSSGILADGIHSGMDIISSGVSYIGIRASKKPGDKEHPYGHYKSEVITGFIITVILFLTSLWIIYDAIQGFISPEIVNITTLSVGVMMGSAIVNEIMARIKIFYGKRADSASLIADGIHSKVDVLTSIGVLCGLILSTYWMQADSLAALLIGFYIMWQSIKLGRETTDSLLGVSAGPEVENEIKTTTKTLGITLSTLKTQKLGSQIFAEIGIEFNPKLKVHQASKISKELKNKLIKTIPNMKYVVIQADSHQVKEGSFKSGFGQMKWEGGFGLGVGGYCICTKCEHKMPHEKGSPCFKKKCPKCGAIMIRYKKEVLK